MTYLIVADCTNYRSLKMLIVNKLGSWQKFFYEKLIFRRGSETLGTGCPWCLDHNYTNSTKFCPENELHSRLLLSPRNSILWFGFTVTGLPFCNLRSHIWNLWFWNVNVKKSFVQIKNEKLLNWEQREELRLFAVIMYMRIKKLSINQLYCWWEKREMSTVCESHCKKNWNYGVQTE